MRLDYFTTTAPWPPTTGARLRVGALHDTLQRHDIDVRLMVVGERPEAEIRRRIEDAGGAVFPSRCDATLPKVFRYVHGALSGRDPVVGQFFDAPGLERFARRVAARRPDAVLLGNVFLAPLIPTLRRHLPGLRIILDNHNVESLLHRRMGAAGGSLRVRVPAGIVARTSQRLEDEFLSRADQVWACSDVDAEHFRRAHRLPRVFTIPNVVDTDELTAGPERGGAGRSIVFTGTLWHPPNDQAAHRLIGICRQLSERGAAHTLYLVGQGPKPALLRRARHNPDVIVTGFVPDIEDYIARADIVAAPLDVGSGTKLKILQAMSMGKAVVTTAIGAEGLHLTHGVNAIVADGSSDFAEHLARLLQSPAERARLGAAARAHVVEHFSLMALRRRMAEALREVLPAVALAG